MSLQATHSPSKFGRYFHFSYDFFKVSLFSPLSFPLYTRYKNPFSQGLSVTGSISNFTHSPFFCKHFFFFFYINSMCFLCFLLLLLLSIFLHLMETIFCHKESACVSLLLVFRRIGEYIFLGLFYLSTSPAVLHSFLSFSLLSNRFIF